jgi:hypothetical protein
MIGSPGCRLIREALGVYVLGAIDPAERAMVDDHLAVCPECREELASLAPLPALLRRVSVAEAERLTIAGAADESEPPAEVFTGLMERAHAVKRARRWRGLAAAAAVIVLALGGGVAVASGLAHHSAGSSVSGQWQTVSGTNASTGVHLTVAYERQTWGTQMKVTISGEGLRPGLVCQFEVENTAGQSWEAGSWLVPTHGGPDWYPATTWLSTRDLHGFKLMGNGRVLAQVAT